MLAHEKVRGGDRIWSRRTTRIDRDVRRSLVRPAGRATDRHNYRQISRIDRCRQSKVKLIVPRQIKGPRRGGRNNCRPNSDCKSTGYLSAYPRKRNPQDGGHLCARAVICSNEERFRRAHCRIGNVAYLGPAQRPVRAGKYVWLGGDDNNRPPNDRPFVIDHDRIGTGKPNRSASQI